MSETYKAVLFDLDGTLLDSAPDLLHTTKLILQQEQREMPDEDALRPRISDGAPGLLRQAFGSQDEAQLQQRVKRFRAHYQKNPLEQGSKLFPSLERLPQILGAVPWGIVTNKTRSLTLPIIRAIEEFKGCQALVCGDDLEFMKPHPMPVLDACRQLGVAAAETLFIGDSAKDIQAGKAAGAATMAAAYGYVAAGEDARGWQADYYAASPAELLQILPPLLNRAAAQGPKVIRK